MGPQDRGTHFRSRAVRAVVLRVSPKARLRQAGECGHRSLWPLPLRSSFTFGDCHAVFAARLVRYD